MIRICKTSVKRDGSASSSTYIIGAASQQYQESPAGPDSPQGGQTVSGKLWGNEWNGGDLDASITCRGDITAKRDPDGGGGVIAAEAQILLPYPDEYGPQTDLASLIRAMQESGACVLPFYGFVSNVSMSQQSASEGGRVVFDIANQTFVYAVTSSGIGRVTYYPNWGGAENYGIETAHGRRPLTLRLYVNLDAGTAHYWDGTDMLTVAGAGSSGGSVQIVRRFAGMVSNVDVVQNSATLDGDVVFDTVRKVFLLRIGASGGLGTSGGAVYYPNWGGAESYGTAGGSGRVPYSDRLYYCAEDDVAYFWDGVDLCPVGGVVDDYVTREEFDNEIAQEIQNRQTEDLALQGMVNAYRDQLWEGIERVDRVEAESLDVLREFYRLSEVGGAPRALVIDGREIGVVKAFHTGYYSRPVVVCVESMYVISAEGEVEAGNGRTLTRYVTYYEQGRGTIEGWSEWIKSPLLEI